MIYCRKFDFDKQSPIEGRYSWEEKAPSDVPFSYHQVIFCLSLPSALGCVKNTKYQTDHFFYA